MGFYDCFGIDVENSFDKMFDINHDGRLDTVEQGMQLEYMDTINKAMEDNEYKGDE